MCFFHDRFTQSIFVSHSFCNLVQLVYCKRSFSPFLSLSFSFCMNSAEFGNFFAFHLLLNMCVCVCTLWLAANHLADVVIGFIAESVSCSNLIIRCEVAHTRPHLSKNFSNRLCATKRKHIHCAALCTIERAGSTKMKRSNSICGMAYFNDYEIECKKREKKVLSQLLAMHCMQLHLQEQILSWDV